MRLPGLAEAKGLLPRSYLTLLIRLTDSLLSERTKFLIYIPGAVNSFLGFSSPELRRERGCELARQHQTQRATQRRTVAKSRGQDARRRKTAANAVFDRLG